jgi:mRNA interferase HicA
MLIKHLKKHGCVLFCEGKKHSIYINPVSNKISAIPRHNEIKRFTSMSICKDLEIPLPEEK